MKSFHSGFDNNVKSYSQPLKSANENLPFYDNLVLWSINVCEPSRRKTTKFLNHEIIKQSSVSRQSLF